MKLQKKEKIIEDCIDIISRKFEKYPHIFLSEEDIRGHLFSELLKKLDKLEKAKSGEMTIPLHLELSFYGDKGRLSERPDIIVIDVNTLDLQARNHKRFYFEKADFGIEIKFNNGSKSKMVVLRELNNDLEKTENLKDRNKKLNFFVMYFDKASHLINEDIEELQQKYNAKIIYVK